MSDPPVRRKAPRCDEAPRCDDYYTRDDVVDRTQPVLIDDGEHGF
ncbi:hypothetical protein [Natronolimnohabitans innermongolicus]|nr:hypothetical protein [Natronolimnohabitans innermongolicus]